MHDPSVYFLGATAIGVSGWAIWRGGRSERLVAEVLMTLWFLTPLVHYRPDHGPNLGAAAVDLVGTVIMTWLSLRHRHLWLLCLAAFQLDLMACHGLKALFHGISLYAYLTGTVIWGGYAPVACLLAGMLSLEGRLRAATPATERMP